MTHYRIIVDGEPFAKERPRFGKGRIYTPSKTKAAEQSVGWAAKLAMKGNPPMVGPVRVSVTAFSTAPASKDLDNIVKLALDGMNKIVWGDDRQVIEIHATKYEHDEPKLIINVDAA